MMLRITNTADNPSIQHDVQTDAFDSDLRCDLMLVGAGGSVSFISGLRTFSGIGIRLFIDWVARCYKCLEHFSIVPHPKDFSLKNLASLLYSGSCPPYGARLQTAPRSANNMACSYSVARLYQTLPTKITMCLPGLRTLTRLPNFTNNTATAHTTTWSLPNSTKPYHAVDILSIGVIMNIIQKREKNLEEIH